MTRKEHNMVKSTKTVKVLYPTMKAIGERTIPPFSPYVTREQILSSAYTCVGEFEADLTRDDSEICEAVYFASNTCPPGQGVGSPFHLSIKAATHRNDDTRSSHTSMSVGDAVQIGEKLYICDLMGFKLLE